MIAENINKKNAPLRVLVSPLDWGLGHATRCIPIINYLLSRNVEVFLAGEGAMLEIIGKTHPKLVILPLKGYRVRYSRYKRCFFLKMLLQAPKIISAIYNEQRWLKKTTQSYHIDTVISDNRFGLHHRNIHSVFITHQLQIKTGNTWLDALARRVNYFFINRFDECWVPDMAGNINLAGELSHPVQLPKIPVHFIGILSRFSIMPAEKTNRLMVLLSGPEPQRSIFENILLPQLNKMTEGAVLVRGLPGNAEVLQTTNDKLTIHNHLPAESLNELILQSEHIVARCGYSTVMDLCVLGQKATLVPTPGQTEQEYLAGHLLDNNIFYTCKQETFSLDKALEDARKFKPVPVAAMQGLHQQVIDNMIMKLKGVL